MTQIVLIEDNPADVYLVKLALKESGVQFEITVYESGQDALLALGDSGVPAPDLILLDLNTPRSDGFEVLGGIRANPRLAAVPLAVLTSSSAPGDREHAALLGNAAYIQKPIDLTAFLRDVGGSVKQLLGA